MSFFEETAQLKQPYAAVDNPPVLAFDEFQVALEEDAEASVRAFAKDIYEHWKARRIQAGNKTLIPSLKFETGADTDEADPYVCFRRREVRQIRKTRGRDAHSAEKLKKLRKELEESRQILALIKQREMTKKEQLAIDRQIFEQRASLRQLKLNLADPYKEGDDDLLINQKVGSAIPPHSLVSLAEHKRRNGNNMMGLVKVQLLRQLDCRRGRAVEHQSLSCYSCENGLPRRKITSRM